MTRLRIADRATSVDAGSRVAHLEARIAAHEETLQRIVEVNERLLIVALAMRADADTAALALDEAKSSATLDALTGLPHRGAMNLRLVQAVAHARRRGAHLALLFLDLDGFKAINDTLGHGIGDALLRLTAVRMRAAVRAEDAVSRHGGDEFLVLITDLAAPGDAVSVAQKLAEAIAAPEEIGGHRVALTASIGMALYPRDGEDVPTLLERADAAMYAAKSRGAGGVAFSETRRPAGSVRPAT